MGYQLAQVTQTRGIFTAVYFRLAKEHERWKRSLEESLHVKERKIEELQQQKESYISQVGRPWEPQWDLLTLHCFVVHVHSASPVFSTA